MGAKDTRGGRPQRTEASLPATDLAANGETWREGGPARKPACRPDGHGGKMKRRGIDRWQT